MRILILVTVWPEPESSAAGWRVMNVVESFQSAGWQVEIGSPSRENTFSQRLRDLGIAAHPLAINDSSFDSWIAEQRYDAVILDRFVIEEQFGWRIRENSPETIRILDTEDLHFLRRARQDALSRGVPLQDVFEDRINLQTDDACREIASIYRSDLSLILSDHELGLLKSRFRVDEELLHPFRFCYSDFPETPGFEERKNFVAIGNFRHPPNADATLWLKREIWPAIRKNLPVDQKDAELHIYGAYPSREEMNLTSKQEGFIVQGPAENAHETLKKYRVNLAPLRFGAGIKGKISDGWRAGAPVATTPIGAEGMTLPDGTFGGSVAASADDLAQKAVRLYTDPIHWQATRAQGAKVLSEYFNQKKNAQELLQTVEALRKNLNHRREKNFLGKMLAHQTLRSTTYFSRWIELKESIKTEPK